MASFKAPDTGEPVPVENFIELNQRIMLPSNYNASSQTVKLQITIPKIMVVDINDSMENAQEIQLEQFSAKVERAVYKPKIEDQSQIAKGAAPTQNKIVEINPMKVEDERNEFADREKRGEIYGKRNMNLIPQPTMDHFRNPDTPDSTKYLNLDLDEHHSNKTLRNNPKQFVEHKMEINLEPQGPESTQNDADITPVKFEDKTSTNKHVCCDMNYKPNTSFLAYNVTVETERDGAQDLPKAEQNSSSSTSSEGILKEKVKYFETPKLQTVHIPETKQSEIESTTKQAIADQVREFFGKPEHNVRFPFTHKRYGFCSDSQIVEELVMNKYGDSFKLSAEKKRKSMNDYKKELVDSENDSVYYSEVSENIFYPCDVSSSTSCEEVLNRTFTIREADSTTADLIDTDTSPVDFDEKVFLEMAVGSHLALADISTTIDGNIVPTSTQIQEYEDISIGTSHLSQLISVDYDFHEKKNLQRQSIATYASIEEYVKEPCGDNCLESSQPQVSNDDDSRAKPSNSSQPISEANELYATVNYEAKKTQRQTVATNASISEPEKKAKPIRTRKAHSSSARKLKEARETLMEQLNEQTAIVQQVSKLLNMCAASNEIYESVDRLEAERVLLIASIREKMLEEDLKNVHYEKVQSQNAQIILSDVTIPLLGNQNITKNKRFFVCVLRCGATVYFSDLLVPDENMELKINRSLCFENIPADFEIAVEIYSQYARISDKKSVDSVFSQISQNLKHLVRPKRNYRYLIHHDVPKRPSFILYAKTSITRNEVNQSQIPVRRMFLSLLPIAHIMKVNITLNLRTGNHICGYLTVGESESSTGRMRWKRQWCSMEETCVIKFWDRHVEDDDVPPNRTLDLRRCEIEEVPEEEGKLCRGLYLRTRSDCDVKELCLAGNNPLEFFCWKKELEEIFTTMQEWGLII